ncbi:MAG: hypothetical protein ACO4AI_10425 [Prochlorothrix sp.]|nr:hypothetical protein [Prochlorothrix sp.]
MESCEKPDRDFGWVWSTYDFQKPSTDVEEGYIGDWSIAAVAALDLWVDSLAIDPTQVHLPVEDESIHHHHAPQTPGMGGSAH